MSLSGKQTRLFSEVPLIEKRSYRTRILRSLAKMVKCNSSKTLKTRNDFKKSKMTKKKMYRMSMGQLQPCNNSNNVSGPQPQRTRGGTS